MGRATRGRREPALRGVDLLACPAAAVWPSWGRAAPGKSTLAAVLLGFLARRGRLGLPRRRPALDRLAGDDLRTVVGLVGQDAYLFDTTVAENLRIGRR